MNDYLTDLLKYKTKKNKTNKKMTNKRAMKASWTSYSSSILFIFLAYRKQLKGNTKT